MSLDVIKGKSFYSRWPMKEFDIGHVRMFYERMGYIVKLDSGKMYLSRAEME